MRPGTFAMRSDSSDRARGARQERAGCRKEHGGEGSCRAADRQPRLVSTEIVDIMKAAGIETPDISILSDEFLAEVQTMEKKNLAMEALRKLINGEIRSQARTNVVQMRSFSERLEQAVARYHSNAITTAQVLQELISLAKDIRAARRGGAGTFRRGNRLLRRPGGE